MWPATSQPRPKWWLLGLLTLLAPAVVELTGRLVPSPGGVQMALESAGVVVIFGLMLIWVRKTRLARELEKPDRPRQRLHLVEPRRIDGPSFSHRRG